MLLERVFAEGDEEEFPPLTALGVVGCLKIQGNWRMSLELLILAT